MNIKHYTSISQSKKLLELGVNPETADMIYTMVNGRCTPFIRVETIDELEEDDVLCWSLGALLEVMPECIVSHDTAFEGEDAEEISTTYYKHLEVDERSMWKCSYKDNGTLSYFKADTLLEAAYSMVVYLLENGFIKKENDN